METSKNDIIGTLNKKLYRLLLGDGRKPLLTIEEESKVINWIK